MQNRPVYSSPSRKPLRGRKVFIIVLLVIASVMALAIFLFLLLWGIAALGFSSLEKSCQHKADSIVSVNRTNIAEFESIDFVDGRASATVKAPSVASGDCIDSEPGMSIEEDYVLSESIDQAISDFKAAAAKAGYAAEYGDEPIVCNTDDNDTTINTYENKSDRLAYDKAEAEGGPFPDVFRDLIPQITCDATGTTATNLKVTFAI